MSSRNWMATTSLVLIAWSASALGSDKAQTRTITTLCNPVVTGPIIVATHDQIVEAGERADHRSLIPWASVLPGPTPRWA